MLPLFGRCEWHRCGHVCVQVFVQTYDYDPLETLLRRGQSSLPDALSPRSGGQQVPPSPRGAVCLGRHPGPLTARPRLTAQHHRPSRPPHCLLERGARSPQALCAPCCSVTLGVCSHFSPGCLSLSPFVQTPIFLTPAQLSPPPLVQPPPTSLLTPGAQPSLSWERGGACLLSVTHPAFNGRASYSGQLLWFCVCGI